MRKSYAIALIVIGCSLAVVSTQHQTNRSETDVGQVVLKGTHQDLLIPVPDLFMLNDHSVPVVQGGPLDHIASALDLSDGSLPEVIAKARAPTA